MIYLRRQSLAICALTMLCALLLMEGLPGRAFAEVDLTRKNSIAPVVQQEKEWEQLPLDILTGAYLISDPESDLFGGAVEEEGSALSQYFNVYPGLELKLSAVDDNGKEIVWIGYDDAFRPVVVLGNGGETPETEERMLVTIPSGVYYLRGSSSIWEGELCAWVKSFTLYAYNCGLSRPDVTSYTEITGLTLHQSTRKDADGRFDKQSYAYPTLGDVFFTPIGTEIILTFKNANVVPYIHCGENYMLTGKKDLFTRYFGFGFSWYYCRTTEICNWLGACYETVNGCARPLTLEELQAAEPHLYIRFPSQVTQTQEAARIRATGAGQRYKRLFTVVHATDTHGDADSTHAAFEYADQIRADFVALTGDYVPYHSEHGYDILHSFIQNAKTPTMLCIGNHDVTGKKDEQVYETIIAPVKSTLQAAENNAYYYRDLTYEGEIVRIISLYPFFDNAELRTRGYYTQEQLMWLCDAMATVPDNGHIFILRHFSHHKPILSDEGQSMFYDYADSSSDVNLWLNMGDDPVSAIVDAYNKKSEIFAQYTGELKDGTESVTVRYDFSNRPDSEFVAYFTGHVHVDAIGYVRNAQTKQVVLSSLCTTGVKGTEEYHSYINLDSPRDYGTDSQIALNVFAFDFQKKTIYIARVGNGVFKDREKTWMKLSYGMG